ncbi:MAG: YHS domain-containing protein, partial [Planctomycetota bacterium]
AFRADVDGKEYHFCAAVCRDRFLGAAAKEEQGTVAVDLVCGMEVRRQASYRVAVSGKKYYFCTSYCRDEFAKNPGAFTAAPPPTGGHTMHGIPSWMYQAAVAVLLLVSFVLLEVVARRKPVPGPRAVDARWNVTASALVRRVLRWRPLRFAAQALMAGTFLLIILAGLFGDQNPATNIAPLLTWTIWWAGLIFLVLFFGKAWCYACPWDALATWLERLKFWGPRKSGLGLQLKWPKALRNIWLAVALFVLLTWVELGLGITMIPRATAWVALAMLGMAVVSVFLFDRKAFCRYACLVGRVSGLYSLFASTELRIADPAVCASCTTMDCYRGNDRGDGCPTFEFPKTMRLSTYCILCTECMTTCPKDNVAVNLRPWGADLAHEGRPRKDEAFLAVILLSMTAFHGLTMTPKWAEWNAAFQHAFAVPEWLSFGLLMFLIMVGPILLFLLLARLAAVWARPHTTGRLFIHYAYSLLPIALFYHLAHNAEHFLMEGPKVLALLSDPLGRGWNLFGTAGWSVPPVVTLDGLWIIQVLFVFVGHMYGLWIAERTTRRLVPDRRAAFRSQLPMLAAMVLFSTFSLWLLKQPMEMRVSAM